MSDITQGVKYTLEAEDKTGNVVDNAGKNLKKAGKEGEQAFRPLEPIIAALHGNFEQAAQGILKMVSGMKKFSMSMTTFTLLAAGIGVIIKSAKVLIECFRDAKRRAEEIKLGNAQAEIKDIAKHQEVFNKLLEQARAKAEDVKNTMDSEANAIREMTKAQLEYNKAKDLSAAKTEKEREAIDKLYKESLKSNDRLAAEKLRENAVNKANADIQILLDEITDLKDARNRTRNDARYFSKQAVRATRKFTDQSVFGKWYDGFTDLVGAGGSDDMENAARWNNLASEARSKEQEISEKLNELELRLKSAYAAKEVLDTTQRTEMMIENTSDMADSDEDYVKRIQKREKLYADWKAAGGKGNMDSFAEEQEREAKKKLEERKKQFVEHLREIGEKVPDVIGGNAFEEFCRKLDEAAEKAKEAEVEAVGEVVEAKIKGEDKVLEKRLATLQVAQQKESDAQARLAAAQAAARQAWGWYRDKDSLKAQLDEEKANAEAEKQFEKDFARLSFRRDWRTAKNLTVDQEAVRRVGLAREEEAAAKKAAEETAANTARAADALEEIKAAMTEEA